MFRRTILSLACITLVPLAHAADHDIDIGFGNLGWNRLFEPGGDTQDERAVAFARTADGGYVVALEVASIGDPFGSRIGLARLNSDGDYVPSGFGSNGRVFKDAMLSSVSDMTIDAQGRIIVVGGTRNVGHGTDFAVVRFNANGSDDTSFSGDGRSAFGFENGAGDFDDWATSVLVDPDGRIVVAGNVIVGASDTQFGIVRFNVDGSLDSTFGDIDDGAGGRRGTLERFKPGAIAYASRVVRIIDGYYVITGTSVHSGSDTNFAARILSSSGRTFVGFSGSETFPIDEPGLGGSSYDRVHDAIVVDPTTILLVGEAGGKFAATRIKVATASGSPIYSKLNWDPSFIGSAIPGRPNRYVGNASNAICESAALRSDGRMVLVGGTQSTSVSGAPIHSVDELTGDSWVYAGLVTRLNADGSPDTRFGLGGSYAYATPTSGATTYSPSTYTSFYQVRFDGAQPVMIGNSVDNTESVVDFDGVITRLKLPPDRIFANDFE